MNGRHTPKYVIELAGDCSARLINNYKVTRRCVQSAQEQLCVQGLRSMWPSTCTSMSTMWRLHENVRRRGASCKGTNEPLEKMLVAVVYSLTETVLTESTSSTSTPPPGRRQSRSSLLGRHLRCRFVLGRFSLL